MILLMAGTSDGREVADFIHRHGIPLVVTTATAYGCTLLNEEIDSIQGPLGVEELINLIKERQIKLLIDVTHPFAVEASRNSQLAVKEASIFYLRWERVPFEIKRTERANLIPVSSYEQAIDCLGDYKRILLTIGSKELSNFRSLFADSTKKVYVRILPLPASLQICWDLGIPSGQIIACQGPFSLEWNLAMFRQYQIQVMVTKESGQAGGVGEKVLAAEQAGVDTILVNRPEVEYINQVSSFEELVMKLREFGICG